MKDDLYAHENCLTAHSKACWRPEVTKCIYNTEQPNIPTVLIFPQNLRKHYIPHIQVLIPKLFMKKIVCNVSNHNTIFITQ